MSNIEFVTGMKFDGTRASAVAIGEWMGVQPEYHPYERIASNVFNPFMVIRNPTHVLSVGDEIHRLPNNKFVVHIPVDLLP